MIIAPYRCYHYTEKENDAITNDDENKATCERHPGFIFTKGDDKLAPGCGTCWCCQPSNINFYFYLTNVLKPLF